MELRKGNAILRTAILILHRKIDTSKKCICGSDMKFVGSNFVCMRQYRYDEPSTIDVYIKDESKVKK